MPPLYAPLRPEEGLLTIKVNQAEYNAADWELLQALAAPHPHINLISGWMDDVALEYLFLEHDIYLSLHRSEGYGLTIREAMLHSLYIVSTGWSGNMDFMQGDRVFAVPYRLTPVNGNGRFFGALPTLAGPSRISRRRRKFCAASAKSIVTEHDRRTTC